MDDFLWETYTSVFKQWILGETSSQYKLFLSEKDENIIIIETDYSHSEIVFNPFCIIELSVTNTLNNRVDFYLHFQMNTLKYAIELFEEMRETILRLVEKPVTKVLLSCSGGLTTTFFTEKLKEATELLLLEYEFHAVPYSELFQIGQDYDVILLAPQIAYMHAKVQEILNDKIVLKIPPQIFAKYDVAQMLTLIQKETSLQQESSLLINPLPLKRKKNNHYKTLCIAMVRISERVYLEYRVYDKENHILVDDVVVKNRISLNDIYDILNTVLLVHDDVQVVGISMPGIINEGHLSLTSHGFNDCDIIGSLSKRYSQKFVLSNDVNCVAVGYYASQERYSSLSFLFQPHAGFPGGVGSIYNGQLIQGRRNIAGEVQYLPLKLSDDYRNMTMTPEGSLELVSQTLVSVISLLGPEVIILSCQLICDIDELRKTIEKYIPAEYIPEIIKIDCLKEYILFGQMIICNQSV